MTAWMAGNKASSGAGDAAGEQGRRGIDLALAGVQLDCVEELVMASVPLLSSGIPLRAVVAGLWSLTKPRVVALIVFCAAIGYVLAVPGWPAAGPLLLAMTGIAAVAGGAAAVNCLVERTIDARMGRTRRRALVVGVVSPRLALAAALGLTSGGLLLLGFGCNPLTAVLTLLTFFGYAIVYTLWLKPATPQNIVIGGASGAMPPVLGWAAATGDTGVLAWLLFALIFVWTPPHFWALALYRRADYAAAGLPMLPVTHGEQFTTRAILLYSWLLLAVSLLPAALGLAGWCYLLAALGLGARFVCLAQSMHRGYSPSVSRAVFAYSIKYLSGIFAALLFDHYVFWPLA